MELLELDDFVVGFGGAHASLNIDATVSLTCIAQVFIEQSVENDTAWEQAQKPEIKINTH